jgi:hypothetical protein
MKNLKKEKKDKKELKKEKDKEKEEMDRYNSKKDNKTHLDILCNWVNDTENKSKEEECFVKWLYSISNFKLLFGSYEVKEIF